MVATHAGTDIHPVYPECVDRFFCWGHAMRELLLQTGTWREDQLIATGSPATDHWLLPRSESRLTPPRAGLTTTFRAINNGKTNHFKWLDQVERVGGDGTYFAPPQHAESWLFFEASLARVMADLVRTLALDRSEIMTIRPHPFEDEVRYKHFQELTDGRVFVTKQGTITEWLDRISILFTCVSASALDAVVRGVPVVSLKGLLDPDAVRKIPSDFHYEYEDLLWQLEDTEQAVDYFRLAAKGELRPCRDEKRIFEFLHRHFLFPRRIPAAMNIALEIKNAFEGGADRKGGYTVPRSKVLKHMVRRHVPMFPQLIALRKYLSSLLPKRKNIGFSYQPWRVREQRTAIQTADKLLSVWNRDGEIVTEPR